MIERMAIRSYNLPVCDGCSRPWLPDGWTPESNPRGPEGEKLRCGKCKSKGWDRNYKALWKEMLKEPEEYLPKNPTLEQVDKCHREFGRITQEQPVVISEILDVKDWSPVNLCRHRRIQGACKVCKEAESKCQDL